MRSLFILIVVSCLSFTVRAQVVINEICPANADVKYDPQFFNFSPWVELYNAGSASVNVTGYYLSDDAGQKTKWRIPSGAGTTIPAHGYLVIWCDDLNNGFHTNFSLKSEGEEVILSNAAGASVDQRTFPTQYTNVSYGRTSDGGTSWNYLITPTPGAANNSSAASVPVDEPLFSLLAGRYNGTKSLSLAHADQGVSIRYTTDGTEPTATSTEFSAQVSVNKTMTVKAKAFRTGFLPSKTVTRTYFVSEHTFSLPVISISTTPDYLWNNTIGIYTDGTNGKTGNCHDTPVNWNQDWDRHAVFEFFDKAGSPIVNQEVDIRIGGACSRNMPQKSFVIKARDMYGDNHIRHHFFDSKNITEFGGFILRNSGNDFNVTHFRDAMLQSLTIDQMDVDYMAYQPTIFYLNGQYWGIQNLREKIDGDYIESNYGYKKDQIDLLETWENALEGTPDYWVNYKNALSSMDRSTPEAFDFIDEHIDVEEYINYLVTEIYYANTDWPGNNIKFWRPRTGDGKFRWILWDTDFGFGLYTNMSYPTHPTLSFATDPDNTGWPNPAASTLHIRMVLENPEFRSRFIKRFNAAMNTTFSTSRVDQVITEFANRIKPEITYHKQRWGGALGDWNYEVQRLRDFSTARNQFMRSHMASFFGLGSSVRMSVTASPSGSGNFKLNGIVADQPMTEQEYFQGLDYTVEALPEPGYKFSHWNVTKRESTSISLAAQGDSWKYFDQGTLPAANWYTDAFNEAAWPQGPGQLGYGEGDEQTIVGYGPDAGNKYITTYFRKSFTLADTAGLEPINASVLFDDGVVVYLNGVEVFRNNLPAGAISNSTPASQAIATENAFVPFVINNDLLKPGVNVIAVEVHQNTGGSTDISFDLVAGTVRLGNETQEQISTPVVQGVAYSDLIFEAVYEEDDRYVSGIVINEVSTRPSSAHDNAGDAEDWIELLNTGSEAVNLTGLYLTDNLNQKTKHKLLAGTNNEMVLAPGQYKVFWADEELNEGADHLSFKLSADGEAVGLYQIVDGVVNVLDEYFYNEQTEAGSFSRLPDGNGPFEFTIAVTPGAPNSIVLGLPAESTFSVYPNPVVSQFVVESPVRVESAELLDRYGRRVRSFQNLGEPQSVEGIAPGLYLLRLQSSRGWEVVKLIKE